MKRRKFPAVSTRNRIFSAMIRGKQYYIKALWADCAARLLQQYGLGYKDLKLAPGHYKESFTPSEIRTKIDKENWMKRKNLGKQKKKKLAEANKIILGLTVKELIEFAQFMSVNQMSINDYFKISKGNKNG